MKWDKVLTDASLGLTEIVLQHSRRRAAELRDAERLERSQSNLSDFEYTELKNFETAKEREISHQKLKKLKRDNISPKFSVKTTSPLGALPDPAAVARRSRTKQANVVNLSSKTLSQAQEKLLSKGLTFCPASGNFNEFQLYQDLDTFARNLRLREYFHDRPNTKTQLPGLSNTSWTPKERRDQNLDMYITAVQKDVVRVYAQHRPVRNNLSTDEREALNSLQADTGIVIKPADKGGAIVILDKSEYLEEGMRQLSDSQFYKELPNDPTKSYETEVQDTLESLLGESKVTAAMMKIMSPKHSVPGRFYLLPKIHKNNHPGRPIVSSNGTVTEKISSFINHIIKDIPPTFPSYIKDTSHFLQEIAAIVISPGCFLVTLDVCSLYTNIPHLEGISATVAAFTSSNPSIDIESETLETLLTLVLNYNHFEFDQKHFLQISGTAMGTKMAPNYANIFMASLEIPFIEKQQNKPLFYRRFLDDIFLIWNHDKASLLRFISEFNCLHRSIKFTHEISQDTINFLDVTLQVQGNSLATTVYRKPTDRQQYLHFDSNHPRHCKVGIPYSQAYRYRRICSDIQEFERTSITLKETLLNQKYPEEIIDDAINRARRVDRQSALSKTNKPKGTTPQTNLILTYGVNMPRVNNILSRHFNMIRQSERLSAVFPEPPRVVYRREKNLRDILVKAKTSPTEKQAGCRPCEKPRCKICSHISPTDTAKSNLSAFSFRIKESLDCDSSNLVYRLHCERCGKDYIGQTENAFRLRFNNHKSHVISKPDLPFSKHMRLPNHSIEHIKITLLQSGFRSTLEREQRESYFIHKFQAFTHGINEDPGRLSFLRQKAPH